jgi:hypothetical protein
VIVKEPASRVLLAFPAFALLFIAPVPSLVVTVALISGVAADPSPVDPTAYS